MGQDEARIGRRPLAALLGAATAAAAGPTVARAQAAPVKVALITPLTGTFASVGTQMIAGARQYMLDHGDTVAGRKVELVIRDDGAVPAVSRRIAQELVVNDKVDFLAGMGLTPIALAVAPISNSAKVAQIVMLAGTSSILAASPFMTCTSTTLPQVAGPFGEWVARHGTGSVVTLVSDYGPGIDTEQWFANGYERAGGRILQKLRVPLENPDFAPFLQRAADAKPDGLFIFVPSGLGTTLMRQFVERGLDRSGIRLLATGDVLDDQIMDQIGPVSLGVISAYHWSDAHDSDLARAFTRAVERASNGVRANMAAVGAYDGMAVIFKALEKTSGKTGGPEVMAAIRGLRWESPRGPVEIDAETRDIVQNVYIRRVEQVDGRYRNVEIETIPMVRDPAK
ncbi:ABC transporter substrate-binding protein [Roseomonas sp. BN140053]|uniref:ABC transporter substrate-binding protein n=1 Tax=Roseomonas sp. BN140053 TaxID=3391898 RepID=UPI0039E88163